MTDPWTRADLWDTARTLALSMLDPVPGWRQRCADEPCRTVPFVMPATTQPTRREKRASWRSNWLTFD